MHPCIPLLYGQVPAQHPVQCELCTPRPCLVAPLEEQDRETPQVGRARRLVESSRLSLSTRLCSGRLPCCLCTRRERNGHPRLQATPILARATRHNQATCRPKHSTPIRSQRSQASHWHQYLSSSTIGSKVNISLISYHHNRHHRSSIVASKNADLWSRAIASSRAKAAQHLRHELRSQFSNAAT
jgi:hypothetical protein